MRKRLIVTAIFVWIVLTTVFGQENQYRSKVEKVATEDKLNSANCGYDSCVFYGVTRWKYYVWDGNMVLAYMQKDKNDKTVVNVYFIDGTLWGYYKLQSTGKWDYMDTETGEITKN